MLMLWFHVILNVKLFDFVVEFLIQTFDVQKFTIPLA